MASCVHAIPTWINWFGVLFSTHPIPLCFKSRCGLDHLDHSLLVLRPSFPSHPHSIRDLFSFDGGPAICFVWWVSYSFCFCLTIFNFFLSYGGFIMSMFMSSTAVIRIVMMLLGFLTSI